MNQMINLSLYCGAIYLLLMIQLCKGEQLNIKNLGRDLETKRHQLTVKMMQDRHEQKENQFIVTLVVTQEEFAAFNPANNDHLDKQYVDRYHTYINEKNDGPRPDHGEEIFLKNLDADIGRLPKSDFKPIVMIYTTHIPCFRVGSYNEDVWSFCSKKLADDLIRRRRENQQTYLLSITFATIYSRSVQEKDPIPQGTNAKGKPVYIRRMDFTDVPLALKALEDDDICPSLFVKQNPDEDLAPLRISPEALIDGYRMTGCIKADDQYEDKLMEKYPQCENPRDTVQSYMYDCLWNIISRCSCINYIKKNQIQAQHIIAYSVNYAMISCIQGTGDDVTCSEESNPLNLQNRDRLKKCIWVKWIKKFGTMDCSKCGGNLKPIALMCLNGAVRSTCNVGVPNYKLGYKSYFTHDWKVPTSGKWNEPIMGTLQNFMNSGFYSTYLKCGNGQKPEYLCSKRQQEPPEESTDNSKRKRIVGQFIERDLQKKIRGPL